MSKSCKAYVCLGSNLGEPAENLARARQGLASIKGISITKVSPVYTTEPQDCKEQPWFDNQIVELAVVEEICAGELLELLLNLELALGRKRRYLDCGETEEDRSGPRVIDLDLLWFDYSVLLTPKLTLPHPRMLKRAFVLIPLRDIAPDFSFPDGTSIDEALNRLEYQVEGQIIHQ